MSAARMCEYDGCDRPSASKFAKYCKPCRKIRQSENGRVQGKKNAAAGFGRISVDLTPGWDYDQRRG